MATSSRSRTIDEMFDNQLGCLVRRKLRHGHGCLQQCSHIGNEQSRQSLHFQFLGQLRIALANLACAERQSRCPTGASVGLLYDCEGIIASSETFNAFAMADKTSSEPLRLLVSNCDKYGTLIPAFSAISC